MERDTAFLRKMLDFPLHLYYNNPREFVTILTLNKTKERAELLRTTKK